jgi:hypothetical protein
VLPLDETSQTPILEAELADPCWFAIRSQCRADTDREASRRRIVATMQTDHARGSMTRTTPLDVVLRAATMVQ